MHRRYLHSASVSVHRCFCTNARIEHMARTLLFCHCWNPRQQERPPIINWLIIHRTTHSHTHTKTTETNTSGRCTTAINHTQRRGRESATSKKSRNGRNSTFYTNASVSSSFKVDKATAGHSVISKEPQEPQQHTIL